MNATLLGLITGLTLGLAIVFGGSSAFLVVLVCGAVGLAVCRYLDGRLDLSMFGAGSYDRTLR
ncbi:hypothetical protein [Pseudonocardia sp. NPDC049154]|uniref:hypothetical protein n=1 Tax=Pseudonocardia sp. NPDC049154 TaxID=3155501 RepID=UPI0033F8DFE7